MRLELKALKAEPRGSGGAGGRTAAQCMAAEAARFEAALPKGVRRVALDEHGARLSTAQLAERMRCWRGDGRDVALLVGGPDGLAPALKLTADEALRLSDLTLPHALARVLLAEALYRAHTVLEGHPYHRE
jgi:23S rRNA (pseudouridine1915-N3)-methyltransferase